MSLSSTTAVCIETKGLLFDMDGVLIRSIGSVVRCWRQWCAMYDVPDAESFEVPHGKRAIEIVRMLKPEFDEPHVLAALRVIEDLEVADTGDTVVLPGAKELLEKLPPERWAIVTSATSRLVAARLAAAGLPVPKRLISADMVDRGKPDPEPYRRGAEVLGFAASDCVVVEDAPSGVGAGIAAGCRVLGVVGTNSAHDLQRATWIVGSLEGIEVNVPADGVKLRFAAAGVGTI